MSLRPIGMKKELGKEHCRPRAHESNKRIQVRNCRPFRKLCFTQDGA